jgi:DNA replication and repair protein RecF
MKLNKIAIRDFRNYEAMSLDFSPEVNLIVGDNAQGKTNLIEAIGYLGSGKSFRTQKNSELVYLGEDFSEVSGSVFSQQRQQSLRWLLFSGQIGAETAAPSFLCANLYKIRLSFLRTGARLFLQFS